ncbi:MAG: hypothetical protein ACK4K0_08270 [Flavobacteriales bacterium]
MKSQLFLILVLSAFFVGCNEPNTIHFVESDIQEDTITGIKEQLIDEKEIIGEIKTGDYFYMADAAIFTFCESGNRYPVLQEEANVDAEKIFLNAQIDDEVRNVFMTIRMSFKEAPNMEGNIVKQILIHHVIDKIEDCP